MHDGLLRAVILSGGSGTRLWPLSRKGYPKQFIQLLGEKSLLQLTMERLASFGDIWCVGAEEHRFLVNDVARAAGVGVLQFLEPEARNTAAAMALAAIHALPDEILLFCPADHYIPDTDAFVQMVHAALPAAHAGNIVTFGVAPSHASTAYGYIEQGQPVAQGELAVVRFVEKPNSLLAAELLTSGRHVWNAGIFLVRAKVLSDAITQHAPAVWRACTAAMGSKRAEGNFIRPDSVAFGGSPSESIDYAVMEKHSQLVVHRFEGAWSDIGSWNAVAEMAVQHPDGNRTAGEPGQAHFLQAENTFVHASNRPVVVLGAKGLLIVDTPDALLVADAAHAEMVKSAVAMLEAQSAPQAVVHRKVNRFWGSYDTVDHGPRHQVKRITVTPGAKLSLQMHYQRAEHWIVVKGTALVTRGEEQLLLHENQSTYIPLGVKHRLENPGKTDLEIIEVQSGGYLGEDDIVRFEDTYGRVSNGN